MEERFSSARIWVHPDPVPIPPEVLDICEGNELLASILVRRGFIDPGQIRGFLNPEEYPPASPNEFPGMQAAVDRILEALKRKQHVLIWGDFDVDGQTSTTILVTLFQRLGWQLGNDLFYHIPNRETEGHGIHLATMESLLHGIDLMITCDTGISANAENQAAVKRGVDVIVTDHHTPPDVLPEGAVALINPHFLPEGHPLSTLAGCGVAFELAQALYAATGNVGAERELLDLVALGLVADVAELKLDTRYLVQRGLQVLRENRRLGPTHLYRLMDLNPSRMVESHIGFQVAPRLNALGRLSDANKAVNFFTTQDAAQASFLAQELDGLNTRRKLLTDLVYQATLQLMEQNPSWKDDPILVISHTDWVGGVLGIVASRLVEKFNKPVILIREGDGGKAAGSARSVPGIDITQAIAAHADILHRFGGHPMAAGLSLPTEMIPDFRQRICHVIRKMGFTGVKQFADLPIEASLTLSDIFGDQKSKKPRDSYQKLEELETLAPYGNGNPAPVFSIEKVHVAESTKIGVAGDHLAITVEDATGMAGRVIWWQGGGEVLPEGWFNLACTIHMNEFGGKREPQLEWIDAQPVPEETQSDLPILRIQYIDYRQSINPIADLVRWRAEKPDLQIWAEGPDRKEVNGADRSNLRPGDSLVLWTTPPGSHEMDQVIENVHPRYIYLVCADPGVDRIEPFLRRLTGLLSSEQTLRQQPVSLDSLAAAMAHRKVTVELGLRMLAEIGKIQINRLDQEGLEYDILSGKNLETGKPYLQPLQFSLQETAAFRRSIKQLSVEQWRRQFFPSVQREGLTNHPKGG